MGASGPDVRPWAVAVEPPFWRGNPKKVCVPFPRFTMAVRPWDAFLRGWCQGLARMVGLCTKSSGGSISTPPTAILWGLTFYGCTKTLSVGTITTPGEGAPL